MNNKTNPSRFPGLAVPHIHSIGISIWDPIHAEQEHVDPYCELIHIIKGEVALCAEGKKFKGRAGDTLLLHPNKPHRDVFPAASVYEVLLVMFKCDNFSQVFPETVNRKLVKLPGYEKQRIRELALSMYKTFQEDRALAKEMTEADLRKLLLFLLSAVRQELGPRTKGPRTGRARQVINEAKRFINGHLAEPMTLAIIADHLRVSEYYLSRLFSREEGFTLSAYLTRLRMEKAASLLADPKNLITEAAYAAGFENPNYFAKAFRRYYNASPSTFRARLWAKKGKKRP
jgi:AraC-like DNA-binding protein